MVYAISHMTLDIEFHDALITVIIRTVRINNWANTTFRLYYVWQGTRWRETLFMILNVFNKRALPTNSSPRNSKSWTNLWLIMFLRTSATQILDWDLVRAPYELVWCCWRCCPARCTRKWLCGLVTANGVACWCSSEEGLDNREGNFF